MSDLKKTYFKFIRSQETSGEQFKDKLRQLKNFYLPICDKLFKLYKSKNRTLLIGLSGSQGSGKSTISQILKIIFHLNFNLNVVSFSIDDFYKTSSERKKMSKSIHPLFMTRGVPGTHDSKMLYNTIKILLKKKFKFIKIPKFDKSIDDRCKNSQWLKIRSKPDVVIFEGWCVGAKPQNVNKLKKPINNLEKFQDKNLIWRKFVNNNLKTHYKKLFKNINYFLYLKASSFSQLQSWRIKQEKKLFFKSKNRKGLKIMSNNDIINFMQTYQRITQNMFKETPKNSSIIFNLNSKHQIKSIRFKK